MPHPPTASPTVIAKVLRALVAERALLLEGDLEAGVSLADLDEEIEECRLAYVEAAVTQIAVLRAELSGPLLG
jgi:hypothetical protein